MGQLLAIDEMLSARTLWRGQQTARPPSCEPTGHAELDRALPLGGWPEHALSEILMPADGVGELELLLPTLARTTQAEKLVVMICPRAGVIQAG